MSVVFISHASANSELAAAIKRWCNSKGYQETFLDFDKENGIYAGEDWEQRLFTEISRSLAIVALITPEWLESHWCFAEVTLARSLGKQVFPLVFKKIEGMRPLPNLQAIDLSSDFEQGMADLTTTAWFGIVAPRATPPAIVDRLIKAHQAAMQVPDVRTRLATQALYPASACGKAFEEQVRTEGVRWAKVVKSTGFSAND